MEGSALIVPGIALAAALASPLGGLLAVWLRPSSLLLSAAVGLAGGVLLGTFAFEMLPKALEMAGLSWAVAGFAFGFGLVYLLDLYVNRWEVAGPEADQSDRVKRHHRRRKPRGGSTSVLAGGTSSEEIIEGIAIGVGGALDPSTALIVGIAIAVDNISEAMSIGELILSEDQGRAKRRILFWTSLIGLALFASALVGWFALGRIPDAVQGVLFALGAGGMFYLTVTDLVPEAESHQFQQSAALAIGAGFLLILILSELM
ncbi:ZIP family metal transporter [Rubellimicrobium arenae]|uniref:ZIP family metal transporter n=1 Tax=Rubellimicrobium arenae TaxID=2817372 RepID=UPI001B303E2C|nr:ZIP family metal transporter [Rubellimicrobium arenae]